MSRVVAARNGNCFGRGSNRKRINKITDSYNARMRLAASAEERKELEKAMEEEKSKISTKPIFVATNTKALQNQIMVKEKPLIEAMLGSEIKIVPVFGRQNYISKRLLNEAEDRTVKAIADMTMSVPQGRKRLKVLRDLISKENALGFTGKFDEFDGQIDDETISEIQSDSDNCQGKKCDNFGSCYY
jgi:ATP-dependent DNA helicase DinG